MDRALKKKISGIHCPLEAAGLIKLLRAAAAALVDFEAEINSLNVFPVPDGDTGTNMKLTFQAMVAEVEARGDGTMTAAARAMARGSLLGARGNSGVILSQIIKGFTEVAAEEKLTTATTARALAAGAAAAGRAVKEPVAGTILTVIDDIAATAARLETKPAAEFLEGVAAAALLSVEKTPALLPVLREAGVVDAGGFGLAKIIEAIAAAWLGRKLSPSTAKAAAATTSAAVVDYNYCTEFIWQPEGGRARELEKKLAALGGSFLFVGDEEARRVHIHTDCPGRVIDLAVQSGQISQVEIHNLIKQSQERTLKAGNGVVAVVDGDGLAEVLLSLGVDEIVAVSGGANPSTAQILQAVERVPKNCVLILPNNKNVIMAAEQCRNLSDKDIHVVPTKTIPQAIAALMAYNESEPAAEVRRRMTDALGSVKSLAVVKADPKRRRQWKTWLGLAEEEIKVSAETPLAAATDLIAAVIEEEDEILTLFSGREAVPEPKEMVAALQTRFSQLEIEHKNGGQSVYHWLLALE